MISRLDLRFRNDIFFAIILSTGLIAFVYDYVMLFRGGSRVAATFTMECFVKIVNGFLPLTIITKCSILDVAAGLDPSLLLTLFRPSSLSGI